MQLFGEGRIRRELEGTPAVRREAALRLKVRSRRFWRKARAGAAVRRMIRGAQRGARSGSPTSSDVRWWLSDQGIRGRNRDPGTALSAEQARRFIQHFSDLTSDRPRAGACKKVRRAAGGESWMRE
jgi:hypothetical protein